MAIFKKAKRMKNSVTLKRMSNWLKSLKGRVQPKQEWSEEDVRKMRAIVTIINSTPQSIICSIDQDRESLCNWLKSLRPQKQWKPTEEQMRILSLCNVSGLMLQQEDILVLKSLYEDLKAL